MPHFFQHASTNTGSHTTGTFRPGTVPEVPAILQQVPITFFLTPRAFPHPRRWCPHAHYPNEPTLSLTTVRPPVRASNMKRPYTEIDP